MRARECVCVCTHVRAWVCVRLRQWLRVPLMITLSHLRPMKAVFNKVQLMIDNALTQFAPMGGTLTQRRHACQVEWSHFTRQEYIIMLKPVGSVAG